MLTNRQMVDRINRWAKKPRAKVPICWHNNSHGRLKAIDLRGFVLLSCTKCSYKLFADYHNLPATAFRKK